MLTHLGDMPVETFLKDYWQQKPLLIRQAFPDFESPLDADEIAGLALEQAVESRLIVEKPKNNQASSWQLECGPFKDADFAKLPPSHWTLLVQAVDHYVPEVAALLDEFRFIPNWRLDDVMVSYAPNGGSVGPHFDYYDVFLLQAAGKRRWQTGQVCSADSPRLKDTPLSILQKFAGQQDWVLEPGDMLYLPPQLAHWGVAKGDGCTTYSFGFRAPSHADILTEVAQDISSTLSNDQRYTDPGLILQDNPGEISDAAIAQLKAIVQQHLDNPAALADWLGRTMTEGKYSQDNEHESEQSEQWQGDDWLEVVSDGADIERNMGARFAYRQPDKNNAKQAHLYVDGTAYACDLLLAQQLCQQTRFNAEQLFDLSDTQHNIITELLNNGSLCIDEGDLELSDEAADDKD